MTPYRVEQRSVTAPATGIVLRAGEIEWDRTLEAPWSIRTQFMIN